MKVGQTNDALPVDRLGQTSTRPAGGGGSSTSEVGSIDSTDKVELSNASQKLAGTNDSVDMAKVDKIKAMIAEGKFKVDAEKIADHMINEAASLLENITIAKPKTADE